MYCMYVCAVHAPEYRCHINLAKRIKVFINRSKYIICIASKYTLLECAMLVLSCRLEHVFCNLLSNVELVNIKIEMNPEWQQ